jgi:hypothetical protein
MKKSGAFVALAGTLVLVSTALLFGGETAAPPADETVWPTIESRCNQLKLGHPPL